MQTLLRRPLGLKEIQTRKFYEWINMIFNKVDESRRKEFGPDRTCAEWLLRNGAAVKWKGVTEYLHDYNTLPAEGTKLYIEEVDATDSSIMHYGFAHFVGCNYIKKIVLHQCNYLQNEALGQLNPLNNSLNFLQVSKCNNIDSSGLIKLNNLINLKNLVLFDLPYVKNKEEIVNKLRQALPTCNIQYN